MAAALAARGNPTTVSQQAYSVIYNALVVQATLLAYIDNFRLLAFLCLLSVPAALFSERLRQ